MPRKRSNVYKDERTGRFCVRITDAYGKRLFKSFGRLKVAEKWELEQRNKRDAVLSGLPFEPIVERPRVTVGQYARKWFDGRKHTFATSTLTRSEYVLGDIESSELADVPVDELTYSHVECWLQSMADERSEDGSPRWGFHSMRLRLDMLKRVTRRMMVEYRLSHWACETVTLPREVSRRRDTRSVMSAEELGRFLKALDKPEFCQTNWRGIFAVMACTGMRPGEVLALRWQDVSLAESEITIQRSTFNGTFRESTKTGSPRSAAITPYLWRVLAEHRKWRPGVAGGLVFPAQSPKGPQRPVWVSALKKPFLRVLKAAQIRRDDLTPYCLRHSFNTVAYAASRGDELTLRDVMGHSSAQMTAHYKHTGIDEKMALQMAFMNAVISDE